MREVVGVRFLVNTCSVFYYSTIMSFYLIRSRERAKYEAVNTLQCPGLTSLQQGGCKRSNYG